MYGLTLFSVLGYPGIYILKTLTNIYIAVDGVFKLLGLGLHPANEAYIWTMGNWWFYSFRRWIGERNKSTIHLLNE